MAGIRHVSSNLPPIYCVLYKTWELSDKVGIPTMTMKRLWRPKPLHAPQITGPFNVSYFYARHIEIGCIENQIYLLRPSKSSTAGSEANPEQMNISVSR